MAITTEYPGSLNVKLLVASQSITGAGLISSSSITATGVITKNGGAIGDSISISRASTVKTTNSGSDTETTTAFIPAGVVLIGVVARVQTILAGSGLTTWKYGDSGALDRYGAALSISQNTRADEADWTADPAGAWSASARDIIFTADAGQFDSGVIRVVAFYYSFIAPTA